MPSDAFGLSASPFEADPVDPFEEYNRLVKEEAAKQLAYVKPPTGPLTYEQDTARKEGDLRHLLDRVDAEDRFNRTALVASNELEAARNQEMDLIAARNAERQNQAAVKAQQDVAAYEEMDKRYNVPEAPVPIKEAEQDSSFGLGYAPTLATTATIERPPTLQPKPKSFKEQLEGVPYPRQLLAIELMRPDLDAADARAKREPGTGYTVLKRYLEKNQADKGIIGRTVDDFGWAYKSLSLPEPAEEAKKKPIDPRVAAAMKAAGPDARAQYEATRKVLFDMGLEKAGESPDVDKQAIWKDADATAAGLTNPDPTAKERALGVFHELFGVGPALALQGLVHLERWAAKTALGKVHPGDEAALQYLQKKEEEARARIPAAVRQRADMPMIVPATDKDEWSWVVGGKRWKVAEDLNPEQVVGTALESVAYAAPMIAAGSLTSAALTSIGVPESIAGFAAYGASNSIFMGTESYGHVYQDTKDLLKDVRDSKGRALSDEAIERIATASAETAGKVVGIISFGTGTITELAGRQLTRAEQGSILRVITRKLLGLVKAGGVESLGEIPEEFWQNVAEDAGVDLHKALKDRRGTAGRAQEAAAKAGLSAFGQAVSLDVFHKGEAPADTSEVPPPTPTGPRGEIKPPPVPPPKAPKEGAEDETILPPPVGRAATPEAPKPTAPAATERAKYRVEQGTAGRVFVVSPDGRRSRPAGRTQTALEYARYLNNHTVEEAAKVFGQIEEAAPATAQAGKAEPVEIAQGEKVEPPSPPPSASPEASVSQAQQSATRAPAWEKVEQTKAYQGTNQATRDAIATRYFDVYVAPTISPKLVEKMRTAFIDSVRSTPITTPKTSNAKGAIPVTITPWAIPTTVTPPPPVPKKGEAPKPTPAPVTTPPPASAPEAAKPDQPRKEAPLPELAQRVVDNARTKLIDADHRNLTDTFKATFAGRSVTPLEIKNAIDEWTPSDTLRNVLSEPISVEAPATQAEPTNLPEPTGEPEGRLIRQGEQRQPEQVPIEDERVASPVVAIPADHITPPALAAPAPRAEERSPIMTWIKGSVATDADGAPLPISYLPAANETRFDPQRRQGPAAQRVDAMGFTFADPATAATYIKQADLRPVADGSNLVPSAVKISNPQTIYPRETERWLANPAVQPGKDGVILYATDGMKKRGFAKKLYITLFAEQVRSIPEETVERAPLKERVEAMKQAPAEEAPIPENEDFISFNKRISAKPAPRLAGAISEREATMAPPREEGEEAPIDETVPAIRRKPVEDRTAGELKGKEKYEAITRGYSELNTTSAAKMAAQDIKREADNRPPPDEDFVPGTPEDAIKLIGGEAYRQYGLAATPFVERLHDALTNHDDTMTNGMIKDIAGEMLPKGRRLDAITATIDRRPTTDAFENAEPVVDEAQIKADLASAKRRQAEREEEGKKALKPLTRPEGEAIKKRTDQIEEGVTEQVKALPKQAVDETLLVRVPTKGKVTTDQIDQAVKDFLAKGGKITKLEAKIETEKGKAEAAKPEKVTLDNSWLDEGEVQNFMIHNLPGYIVTHIGDDAWEVKNTIMLSDNPETDYRIYRNPDKAILDELDGTKPEQSLGYALLLDKTTGDVYLADGRVAHNDLKDILVKERLTPTPVAYKNFSYWLYLGDGQAGLADDWVGELLEGWVPSTNQVDETSSDAADQYAEAWKRELHRRLKPSIDKAKKKSAVRLPIMTASALYDMKYQERDIPLDKLGFYSKMALVLGKKLPNRGTPSQYKELVKKYQDAGDFKREEIKWSGINEWLDDQPSDKRISRDDVVRFVWENKIDVGEVRYPSHLTSMQAHRYEPHFGQYTLPGGSNYRELLLTLPKLGAKPQFEKDQEKITSYQAPYRSPHWDRDNVIAHARIKDRLTPNGERVLFIEEIQSDWGTQARERGVIGEEGERVDDNIRDEEYNQIIDRVIRKLVEKNNQLVATYNNNRTDDQPIEMPADTFINRERAQDFIITYYRQFLSVDRTFIDRLYNKPYKALYAEFERLNVIDDLIALAANDREFNSEQYRPAVPPAPFLQTWPELALKRLIQVAAEEGYDYISWTNAKDQSERWSADYEDMYKLLYDQTIPSFIGRFGKRFNTTVSQVDFTIPGEYVSEDLKRSALPITNEMRSAVLREGFPLYEQEEAARVRRAQSLASNLPLSRAITPALKMRARQLLGEDADKFIRFVDDAYLLITDQTGKQRDIRGVTRARLTPDGLKGLIEIAALGADPFGTVDHESLHWAMRFFFTYDEITRINEAFKPGSELNERIAAIADKAGAERTAESIRASAGEAAAYSFQLYARGDFSLEVHENLWKRFLNFARAIYSWIRGDLGYNSIADAFDALIDGSLASRALESRSFSLEPLSPVTKGGTASFQENEPLTFTEHVKQLGREDAIAFARRAGLREEAVRMLGDDAKIISYINDSLIKFVEAGKVEQAEGVYFPPPSRDKQGLNAAIYVALRVLPQGHKLSPEAYVNVIQWHEIAHAAMDFYYEKKAKALFKREFGAGGKSIKAVNHTKALLNGLGLKGQAGQASENWEEGAVTAYSLYALGKSRFAPEVERQFDRFKIFLAGIRAIAHNLYGEKTVEDYFADLYSGDLARRAQAVRDHVLEPYTREETKLFRERGGDFFDRSTIKASKPDPEAVKRYDLKMRKMVAGFGGASNINIVNFLSQGEEGLDWLARYMTDVYSAHWDGTKSKFGDKEYMKRALQTAGTPRALINRLTAAEKLDLRPAGYDIGALAILFDQSIHQIDELVNKLDTPKATNEDKAKLVLLQQSASWFADKMLGGASEAGRSLRSLKNIRDLLKQAGRLIELTDEVLATAGGSASIDAFAKAWKKERERKGGKLPRELIRRTWFDNFITLYTSGLLSATLGTASAAKALIENTLFALSYIPEQVFASMTPTWHKPTRQVWDKESKSYKTVRDERPEWQRVHTREALAAGAGMLLSLPEAVVNAATGWWKMESRRHMAETKFEQKGPMRLTKGPKALTVPVNAALRIWTIGNANMIAVDEFASTMNEAARRNSLSFAGVMEQTKDSKKAYKLWQTAKDASPDIQLEALNFALNRTYQDDPGYAANLLINLGNRWKITKLFGNIFVKTLFNTVTAPLKYNVATAPFFKSVRDDIKAGGRRAQEAQGKIVYGTLAAGLFATYAMMGMITGSGPPDKEENAMWRAEGNRPNSFKLPWMKDWRSYEFLGASSIPISMMADLVYLSMHHAYIDEDKRVETVMGGVLKSLGHNILDKASPIPHFIAGLAAASETGFNAALKQWTSTFVPMSGFLRGTAARRDPLQRTTGNDLAGLWESYKQAWGFLGPKYTLKSQAADMPFAVDLAGQPTQKAGSLAERLISPLPRYAEKNEPWLKALREEAGYVITRVDKTYTDPRTKESVERGDYEYNLLQVIRGELLRDYFQGNARTAGLVNTDEWKNADKIRKRLMAEGHITEIGRKSTALLEGVISSLRRDKSESRESIAKRAVKAIEGKILTNGKGGE